VQSAPGTFHFYACESPAHPLKEAIYGVAIMRKFNNFAKKSTKATMLFLFFCENYKKEKILPFCH
jgi:hypothetical protein